MSERLGLNNLSSNNNCFADLLADYVGETVTIFTGSGGQSGVGFTGVILGVNEIFVRLITRVGPPPGCSLGNACSNFNVGCGEQMYEQNEYNMGSPMLPSYIQAANKPSNMNPGGWNGFPVYSVGAVTDIPINSIVSFVHNAV